MRVASLYGLCLAFVLTLVASAAPVGFYVESGGQVVGEGELFSDRTPGAGTTSWLVVPDEAAAGPFTGARGGSFVRLLPDDGMGAGGPTNPPSIEYLMRIDTPGTYQLYTRWDGTDGSSDSLFVDVVELKDGLGGSIADWYEMQHGTNSNFAAGDVWDAGGEAEANEAGPSNNPILWAINVPGFYTLRFSEREDGAAVDAFVFQLQNLGAPTGNGPATSEFQLIPEPSSLAVWSLVLVGLGTVLWRRLRR